MIRLAIWFGLLGGAVESLIIAITHYRLGRFSFLSRQVYWMAPLSAACVLAGLGVLFWLGERRRPGIRPAAIATFAAIALLGILLHVPRVHPVAWLVVAAGAGVQVSRIATARREAFDRLVRRTLPLIAGLVVLAGAVQNISRVVTERRQLAALPAPAADAPNVLLLILDTVRSLDLSLYGYSRQTTPWLDRFAQRGVVFDRAIAPAPWTLPSHASMFTGRHASELSASWRVPLDGVYPTLAEVLVAHGYATAGFAANHAYASHESGLARGFAHYEGIPDFSASTFFTATALERLLIESPWSRRLRGAHEVTGRTTAAELHRSAVGWLGAHTGRPWFVFMNFYDAHDPYLPPAPFDTMFTGRRTPWSARNLDLATDHPVTPADPMVHTERDAYDQSIRRLDDALRALVADLESRGALRNTIVIVTSDHGEEFAEHGLLSHGNSLYLPSLMVPLVVVFEGNVPAGRRVAGMASLRDLAATILDLARIPAALPGRSLKPRWGSPADSVADSLPALAEVRFAPRVAAWFPVHRGDMVTAVTNDRQLIRDGTGAFERFDLARDPAGGAVSTARTADTVLARWLPPPHR